ncbi:MAG: dicarboxylate/amino acid:cation symporter [Planctomycetota bacterium]
MSSPTHSNRLTLLIIVAIVLAIVVAFAAPVTATGFAVGGDIFLRLLKMIVVPLVVTSVMSGILGLGDVRKLGRPGGATIGYYLATTILSVVTGLVVVNAIGPGKGIGAEALAAASAEGAENERAMEAKEQQERIDEINKELIPLYVVRSKYRNTGEPTPATDRDIARLEAELKELKSESGIGKIVSNLTLMLFTDNLFKSAAETDLLPLIAFSIVFAGMLTTLGERVDGLTSLIDQINHALMQFVLLIMNVAPIGIFCLVAAKFGKANADGTLAEALAQIGWFVLTVIIGLSVHAFITLPLILWVFTRRNPYRFMLDMGQALLTAFSTASSSATLPVTMETAVRKAGVKEKSVEFVVPIGATINMDGTALYEAATAIFIAQALGDAYDLTLAKQITIALTATLAAIGAAGIPEAGLVTMVIVLNAVGLPVEAIGFVLSVDWFLDRFRTTVNVLGDAMGSAVVEGTLPDEADAAPA